MLDDEKLLFDELYEKTKDCSRVQFVKLLMTKERENQELKEQLDDANEKTLLLQASEPMLNYKKALEETQQKEFINWLENGIEKVKNTKFLDERIQRAGLIAYNRCLQKYRKIIGE